MSLVLAPPPPLFVYPNTVSPPPSTHSKGSFGAVFIVLAVIFVVSAIACFLGRLCNRHYSRPKPRRESQDHTTHPKPRRESQDYTFQPKEGGVDLEFGFKKGIPTPKPAVNGGRKDSIPSFSFETREDIKAAENGAPKARG
ncbi:uncharacterized protein LOC122079784 [Macadamia integrifolia]|uniref:uncharacterized protein LOC122079784 n=1 Tax=Macadamia integrifolia TaxID=60698 RepID=UPI001C4E99CB|nr:uncharacterized protein LOC122079784 [Macadamia integrifolia]